MYLVRAVCSKVPTQFGCTLERCTEISTWVASNWRLFTLRTAQRSANPYTGTVITRDSDKAFPISALQLLELVMLGCSEQHQFKPFTSARPSTQVHHCPLLQPCRQQRNLKLRHAQASQASSGDRSPLVKICGITTLKDAKLAAAAGADFLGMIMWQKAKRAVSASTAKDIASLAGDMGIKSVGVFVDESAQQIQDACVAAGVHVAQLHGGPSREALFSLPESLQAIYVMNCNDEGRRLTPTPAELAEQTDHVCNRHVQWLLIDGQQGGSGKVLPWEKMTAPQHDKAHGWLLAGGLHPDNVADAIAALHPTAVDVSSGVTGSDGMTKSEQKIKAFIAAAKGHT